jgi:hypothetical protein
MHEYVSTYLDSRAARQVRLTPRIYRQIVQNQWQETNEYSVGPMIQRYVLVKFDDTARSLIRSERNQAIVAGRLWYVGGAMAVVLALLSVLFVGLKIDGATEGTYRGRLLLAGIAVMVPVIAVVYLVLASASVHPITLGTPPAVGPNVELTSLAASNQNAAAPRVTHSHAGFAWLSLAGIALLGVVVALVVNKKTRVAGMLVAAAVAGALVWLAS